MEDGHYKQSKNMKKAFLLFFSAIAAFTIMSCNKKEEQKPDPDKPVDSTKVDLTIDVYDITASSFKVDITPEDKELTYFFILSTTQYLSEKGLLDDDQALIDSDIATIRQVTEDLNISEDEAWGMFTAKGDTKGKIFDGQNPGTEYQIYAYGVDPAQGWKATTEVYRKTFLTPEVSKQEISFEVSYTVDGANIEVSVKPSENFPYVIEAHPASFVSESGLSPDEYFTNNWNEYVREYSQYGYTPSMFLSTAYRGEKRANMALSASTQYYLGVFALDEETALVSSDVAVSEFKTEAVTVSGITIDITVSEVGSRSAHVNIVPSNNDSYSIVLVPSEDISGKNDQEIAEYFALKFNLKYVFGPIDDDITSLNPETAYSLFAFGLEGGQFTSGLFRKDFTTTAAESSSLEVVPSIRYFDYEELAAQDQSAVKDFAGYDYVGVLTLDTKGGEAGALYAIFTSPMGIDELTDEELGSALVAELPVGRESLFGYYYDSEIMLIAMATDQNGNWGKVYRSEPFVATYEGADKDAKAGIDIINSLMSETSSAGRREVVRFSK